MSKMGKRNVEKKGTDKPGTTARHKNHIGQDPGKKRKVFL